MSIIYDKERLVLKNNIKKQRLLAGLTQADAALFLGVDRSTYTYYESGKTIPSVFQIKALSDLYSCKIEDFLIE